MSVFDPPTDDTGEPIRTPHIGARPGGSSPGSGGGFSSFAGGGGGFNYGLSGGSARGSNPSRRRITKGGGTEVGGMAPGDTVPAWLDPREFVVQPEAAHMFGPELEHMNALGNAMRARGMSMGGYVGAGRSGGGGDPVPMIADHYSLGGWIKQHPLGAAAIAAGIVAAPFALPALAGTGAAASAMGAAGEAAGAASGFAAAHPGIVAAGKVAGPFAAERLMPQRPPDDGAADYYALRGGGGSPPQEPPWPYAQHMAGGGWAQPPRPQPAGGFRQPTAAPQMTPAGASAAPTMGSAPVSTAPPQPSPAAPPSPWSPSGPNVGDVNRTISGYGQAGMFSPGGSAQTNDAIRAGAMQDASAYADRAYLGANVGGLDPAAAQAYKLQALASAGSGVGSAMVDYRAKQATSEQDYARHLLDTYYGNISADERARLEEWLAEKVKRVH